MKPIVILLIWGIVMPGVARPTEAAELFPRLAAYLKDRLREFDQIPSSRKEELERVSDYIQQRVGQRQGTKLTFVCTHNSRRSQFAQIWATVAASRFGVQDVQAFSGGTEVTAMNGRCVEALRRCGFQIVADDPSEKNPRYQVKFLANHPALVCFSKHFASAPNPTSEYCAVMTCSHADENCPVAAGSDLRVAITYEDPKLADDTPEERDAYDERSRQIAREMLYMMSRVSK